MSDARPSRLSKLFAGLRGQRVAHSNWMLTSGAVRSGAAFAANLVLVRFVAPDGFGRYALTLATIGLVYTVLSLKMNVQVIRMSDAELTPRRERLLTSAMLHEALLAGLVSLGWLLASGTWTGLGGLLLASILLRHFFDNLKAFYERRQPYRTLAVLEGGNLLFAHGLSVVLVLAGAGELALYVRELSISVLSAVLLVSIGAVPLPRPRLVRPGEWRELVRHARGVWLDGMLGGSFARVAVLLAGAAGAASGAGYFFQAQRLAQVPQELLGPLVNRLTLNWFSRDAGAAERARSRRTVLRSISVPLAAAAVGAVLLADPVVPLLFGEDWRPAAGLLANMAGVVLFASLFTALQMYLIASRYTRYVIVARVGQFAGLGLPLGLALSAGCEASVEDIALGLSFAFAFAFAVAWALARRLERRA